MILYITSGNKLMSMRFCRAKANRLHEDNICRKITTGSINKD